MSNILIETITSSDPQTRNRSIDALLQKRSMTDFIQLCRELDVFRRQTDNLYHRVRASLFLSVMYRYYLANHDETVQHGHIPFEGVRLTFDRRFDEAIEAYAGSGLRNSAIFSALGDTYYKASFEYLLDQVKRSMSSSPENHHLYTTRDLSEYPFSVPDELLLKDGATDLYPVGMDASPVRLDPSHSGWSDIFFLGMDFPEGARVVNLSVDLRVHGDTRPLSPPCKCYCRYIEESAIILTSIDLGYSKTVTSIDELFNFGNDYLSLLKAGVVASGIVPPCFEKIDVALDKILHRLMGKPGGIEIVTEVEGIPKGSRLAVSTTLLATIITRLMRFSGQIASQSGGISEEERRIVASRAILGEWLGGSGGGWQDSGGLWPGVKLITGKVAGAEDSEHGTSRGCLLPRHHVLHRDELSLQAEKNIIDSFVLIHGGMSQNVGPILEMVTEKYLLKYENEWKARLQGVGLFNEIVQALKSGDMKELGRLTTQDWEESIQKVIPWVNNAFTEELIQSMKQMFGNDYYGFLMLGGMSGGGMAFIVSPQVRDDFKSRAAEVMLALKDKYSASYPFLIDPVVYDFELNHEGIQAHLLKGQAATLPEVCAESSSLCNTQEIQQNHLDDRSVKKVFGFDVRSHEDMKLLLKRGEIGLYNNRLSEDSIITDIAYNDITRSSDMTAVPDIHMRGQSAIRNGEVGIVTFAGGMGSRWSQGFPIVKAIHPFMKIDEKFRTFLECHLAKSRKTGALYETSVPHVFTTSYLTQNAIETYLEACDFFGSRDRVYLSPSQSIGHRVYPTERDLRFYWQDQLEQKKDDQAQKVQDDIRNALIEWARTHGEGEDYKGNPYLLRFNPPGHWHEIPNLLKNGSLALMIQKHERLNYLLCHNIDTMGAFISADILGLHMQGNACITFEVTPRRIEDAGGGLAFLNGRPRLIEGLALPREEDEFKLSFYNTLTNWITIDAFLDYLGLNRDILIDAQESAEKKGLIIDALYSIEKKIPAYVTIKNVSHIWGSGQEDTYPVAQFEKLWGDMTALEDLSVQYIAVPRYRGVQLKDPALLDMWAHDGSYEYFREKCIF